MDFINSDDFYDKYKKPVEAALSAYRRERRGMSQDDLLEDLMRQVIAQRLMIDSLIARVDAAEKMVRLNDQLIAVPPLREMAADMPDSIDITAEFPLDYRNGFYFAEESGDAKVFRWTGPGESFCVELFLDRSKPLRAELDLIDAMRSRMLKGLSCFVDDRHVPLAREDKHYELVLPVRESQGLTRIEFFHGPTHYPRGISALSPDARKLGVAFQSLRIAPAGAS